MRSSTAAFRFFRALTSPVSIMAIVWTLSLFVYWIASTLGGDASYFHFLVSQGQVVDRSNAAAYMWLFVAFSAFVAGAGASLLMRARSRSSGPEHAISESRSLQMLTAAFLVTLAVALAWVGGAILQFGGVGRLAALAASDNAGARELILSASFPGGRLLSSGFVGIAIYAATLMSKAVADNYSRRYLLVVAVIFGVSMLYLAVMPILVSGRVNFFVAAIGSFVAASYASRRMIPIRYGLFAVVALSIVWGAKQYFTLGHVAEDVSVEGQAAQGILFYFYNDVLNVLNNIGSFEGNYTLGWYSLRFVFFFTFTDKLLLNAIAGVRQQIDVTAGEVPLLGAPLVDFGVVGIVLLFAIGFFVQYMHMRASRSPLYVASYGVVCACLLLSVHSTYLTSQEIVYSLLLLKWLAWKSKTTATTQLAGRKLNHDALR